MQIHIAYVSRCRRLWCFSSPARPPNHRSAVNLVLSQLPHISLPFSAITARVVLLFSLFLSLALPRLDMWKVAFTCMWAFGENLCDIKSVI